MDILIKNIEMPKGEKDFLEIILFGDGSVGLKDDLMGINKHTDKAIELPSHNDLADKSVIIESMGNAHDELWDKVDKKALSECHVAFLKAVMRAPTVLERTT